MTHTIILLHHWFRISGLTVFLSWSTQCNWSRKRFFQQQQIEFPGRKRRWKNTVKQEKCCGIDAKSGRGGRNKSTPWEESVFTIGHLKGISYLGRVQHNKRRLWKSNSRSKMEDELGVKTRGHAGSHLWKLAVKTLRQEKGEFEEVIAGSCLKKLINQKKVRARSCREAN